MNTRKLRRVLVPYAMAVTLAAWSVLAAAEQPASRLPASRPAATQPAATRPAADAGWKSLFDGKSLEGWKSSDYGGQGEPAVKDGALVLPTGVALTGVTYAGDLPTMAYEISLEAKRVNGADFFCGLTFPVGDSHASLIVGGWGGSLCGVSSLDGEDAAHNETSTTRKLVNGKWYTVRLRVLPDRLVAWLGDDKIVNVDTTGKKISVRADIEPSKPFGIASYQTTAALATSRCGN